MENDQRMGFDEVRRFCASRSVDLTLGPGDEHGRLGLRAGFDGYGDFFVITAHDVEYAEVPGGCYLGGLHLAPWDQVAVQKHRWASRGADFSGSALAFWDDDAESFEAAPESRCYVIVAREFSFRAGRDWPHGGK